MLSDMSFLLSHRVSRFCKCRSFYSMKILELSIMFFLLKPIQNITYRWSKKDYIESIQGMKEDLSRFGLEGLHILDVDSSTN